MSKRKTGGNFSGKGYYIALLLCAVAIGITGYLYYRNVNDPQPQLQNPSGSQLSNDPTGSGDLAAIATEPNGSEQKQPVTQTQKPVKTAMPLEGQTISLYAMDSLCYNQTTRDWRVHDGIDIAAAAGTKVCAAADGTVSAVYEDDTMGTTVVISHTGGYTTSYASLDTAVTVAQGDKVLLGQQIGCVGSSALLESAIGDHVHFSVACNNKPVDPAQFVGQE